MQSTTFRSGSVTTPSHRTCVRSRRDRSDISPNARRDAGIRCRRQTAKAMVDSGRYGDVVNVRGVYGKSTIIPFSGGWRSQRSIAGGGILLDQGIHMLDMIRLFCGDFPEVYSCVSNDYWHHDVEDNAFALMRSATGVVAMVHSSAT